jgi:hypothetical protein
MYCKWTAVNLFYNMYFYLINAHSTYYIHFILRQFYVLFNFVLANSQNPPPSHTIERVAELGHRWKIFAALRQSLPTLF